MSTTPLRLGFTTFPMPSKRQLGAPTHRVFVNNDWAKLLGQKKTYGSSHDREQVIPAKLGSPSKIKHIFLIIKEPGAAEPDHRYASTGWTKPYPGDDWILAPNEVPGRDTPPQEIGD
ncbi:hypothetical protein [Streptomyces sp. NPDC048496]|uniref:hypothetical protein n=1 Tax=Streptomyces sp. NPDC048496 TaxID=3365558 RepID=UPI003712E01C